VSPSWRKRIVVGLAPDQVTVLRFSRGLRPALEEAIISPVANPEPGQWQTAVKVLTTLLGNPAWGNADVDLVMSNHFVRYALVPGNRALKKDEERLAFAGILFEQQYGPLSRDWELKLGNTKAAMATLASGIPRLLLTALREGIAQQGRLRSLRPLLMNAFNIGCRALNQQEACLAIVETGRITLAWMKNDQWQNVSSRATNVENPNALSQLLAEDAALHGLNNSGTLLMCDLTGAAQLRPGSAWVVQPMTPPSFSSPEDVSANPSGIPLLAQWGLA
jgi:hypothetical protein